MPITIDWLLNQPHKMYQCIAGHKGTHNSITGINIMDNPDTVPWLKKDELVLSTGYIFLSTQIYKSIIRDLHNQGCSGLGIKMNRYIDEIPTEMIEQANELGFPIFSIPFSSTMEEIVNLVYHEMFQSNLSNEKKWIVIYKDIMESALNKHDILDVLERMSHALDSPCFFTTSDLQLIDSYYENVEKDMSSFPLLMDGNYLFSELDRQQILTEIYDFSKPILEKNISYDNINYNYYLYPLIQENNINGFFICLCINQSISKDQHELIVNLKSIFDIFAIKEQKAIESQNLSYDSFYHRILSGTITLPDEIELECRRFGFEFERNLFCLVIQSLKYMELSVMQQRAFVNKIIAFMQACALKFEFELRHTIYNNDLVVFIQPNDNSEKMSSDWIREPSLYIEKKLATLELDCLFGYSRLNSGATSIYTSYVEAQRAISLGKKLHHEKISFLYYDDLIYHQLSSTLTTAQLYNSYYSCLKKIEDYDSQNNTCLLATLEIYINCNLNTSQAAKKLFIHRNTMIHRMEQIKELLPLDIKNPDHIYLIQTAFYAKKLLT